MALLYHWRKENYRSYLEEWPEDNDLHLVQNSHSWRDAKPGESVWAFSRREDGAYVLVASYQIESVDRADSEFGQWIAFSIIGSTRYYDPAAGADIEPLIRELPLTMNNPTLGRNFQGPAGVKKVPTGFERSFADFASRQQLLSKRENDLVEIRNKDDLPYTPSSDDHRAVALREIKQRKGQAKFRQALLESFNHKCAITGCDILEILEAAHINPARGIKDNHVSNGLLLRADIHTLFDLHLLGIHPETLKIHLKKEANKSPYSEFENSIINAEHVISGQSLWVRWQQFLMS